MKKIILYIRKTNVIGGLETFIYNFCCNMHNDYDITVMAGIMADVQVDRLRPMVKVITGNAVNDEIECDTLVMMRVLDPIPKNVKYKKCFMCNQKKHQSKHTKSRKYKLSSALALQYDKHAKKEECIASIIKWSQLINSPEDISDSEESQDEYNQYHRSPQQIIPEYSVVILITSHILTYLCVFKYARFFSEY